MSDRFEVANFGTTSLEIQDAVMGRTLVVLRHPEWDAGAAGLELAELMAEILNVADELGELEGTVLAGPAPMVWLREVDRK